MLLPAFCLVVLGFVALSAFTFHSPVVIETPQGEDDDFQSFLNVFSDASFPYVISEKDLQNRLEKAVKVRNGEKSEREEAQQKAKRLEYRLHKFLPEVGNYSKFSRAPVTVEPVAKLDAGKYYAIIYCSAMGFFTDKSYSVALLDKTGKHHSTHSFAHLTSKEITEVKGLQKCIGLTLIPDLGEVERLFQHYLLQTFDLSEVRKTLKCYISATL